MSNIPSAKSYIQQESVQTRRPVSESLLNLIGAAINYNNDKVDFYAGKLIKSVAFTTSGTVTIPQDVSIIFLYGIGGGGGGGAGAISSGGGSSMALWLPYAVTPSAVLPFIIGSGGASASNGTATTFNGDTVSLGGGAGNSGSPYIGGGVGAGGIGGSGGSGGASGGGTGQSSARFSGGGGYGDHGGGAASLFGVGGNAGPYTGNAGGGYGAGGGGSLTGGHGGDGYLEIFYLSGY